jgi:hypothetical protein
MIPPKLAALWPYLLSFTLAAGVMSSAPPPARAATVSHGSVTATATATLTVLAPATISPTQALTFAAMTRPANGRSNTVSVDANDRMTVTGQGNGAPTSGRAATAGVVQIAGPPNTVYSLDQALRFLEPGLSSVAAGAAAVRGGAPNLIPASGLQQVRFGGTFRIDPATAPGAYNGFLAITVNYD